jgi:CRP-like cAMP-binding protein
MDDALHAFLSSATRIEHDAGETIVPSGPEDPCIGYVEEGLAKGVLLPRHGPIRQANVGIAGDRHWLGLECIAEGYNVAWRALTDCRVRLFRWNTVRHDLPSAVSSALLHEASWVLNRTMHLNYIARLPLDQRVLSRLCDLREACSLPEIAITHEDLASLVGVHRNKIGVSLKRLQAKGLLTMGYGEIHLGALDVLEKAYREAATAE